MIFLAVMVLVHALSIPEMSEMKDGESHFHFCFFPFVTHHLLTLLFSYLFCSIGDKACLYNSGTIADGAW